MWINVMIQYSKLEIKDLKSDPTILNVLISSTRKLIKSEVLPVFIFESLYSEHYRKYANSCQLKQDQIKNLLKQGKVNKASLISRSCFFPPNSLINLFCQYLKDSSIIYYTDILSCNKTLIQMLNQEDIEYILSFDPSILLQMPRTFLYQCSSDFHTVKIVFDDILKYYQMDSLGFQAMCILTGESHPELKVCTIAQYIKYSNAQKNVFQVINDLRSHGYKTPIGYEEKIKKILNIEFANEYNLEINVLPKTDIGSKEQRIESSSQMSPKAHVPGQMNLFGEVIDDPSPKKNKAPIKNKI